MKDEEMAEQFADNISGLELTCSLLSAKDKSHSYRLGRYDGFLAGLKAGRPQWHYVKDGLPKESKKYYVYSEEWGVEVRKFIADAGCFECRNNIIIAWKEIVLPKESK